MDGKVQSSFRLTPGSNPRVFAQIAACWSSAVRSIRLTPPPYFPSSDGILPRFSFLGRDMPSFGVSAHLVAGLWGGDGGGAVVDQGGQLVEADDAEEVA